MEIVDVAKAVSAVGGAALVVFHVVSKLNKALIGHLNDTFATKEDFARVEDKLDVILLETRESRPVRRHKASAQK